MTVRHRCFAIIKVLKTRPYSLTKEHRVLLLLRQLPKGLCHLGPQLLFLSISDNIFLEITYPSILKG